MVFGRFFPKKRPPTDFKRGEDILEFCKIVHKHGYCEAQDQDGQFILSADTEAEIWREIDSMERECDLD